MSAVKKALASWLKVLAYPVTRPVKDIAGSVTSIRDSARRMREARTARAEAAAVFDQATATAAGAERFRQLYLASAWTPAEIERQILTIRRARIASLIAGGVCFVALLWLMAQLQGWLVLLLGIAAIMLVSGALVTAIRQAWWEYEMSEHELLPLRQFMRRRDLWVRVFKATA